jgi:hypothetical protein
VMEICDHWSTDPSRAPFESPGLRCERPRPYMSLYSELLTFLNFYFILLIRIQLFNLIRIRIQLFNLIIIRIQLSK